MLRTWTLKGGLKPRANPRELPSAVPLIFLEAKDGAANVLVWEENYAIHIENVRICTFQNEIVSWPIRDGSLLEIHYLDIATNAL